MFKPSDWKASDRRAAIVFFFGGGWVSGTPEQFYPQCRHLADLGMVAISAEYRTRNSHGVTPEKCVEDGSDAIAWVQSHAEELGIDVNRIAAGGGSAGGHVAATTGTGVNQNGSAARPALLVLFNPVLDTSPSGFKGARVLGEKAIDISPLHHLDADVPPTLIFLGDADSIVPVSDAAEFHRQLASHGIECELALYADEPHGFFNSGRRSYADTLRVMDAFLSRYGFFIK
ncbi:MAG: alpha/beta hydrolase fold domain-containing protein [Verrucomicrobiales bacterium]